MAETTNDIFRNGRFEADEWRLLGPDEPVPTGGALFVPLARWQVARDDLRQRNAPTGVMIDAGEDVKALAGDIDRLSAVAVAFPKFSDGRGYSTARILREELGFRGEIRAVGDVLLDQIPLMRRCGIDAFAVSHAPTRAALEAGETAEVALYYQPVGSPEERPAGTRPWLRRPERGTTTIKSERA